MKKREKLRVQEKRLIKLQLANCLLRNKRIEIQKTIESY